jgi:hypothetical protein
MHLEHTFLVYAWRCHIVWIFKYLRRHKASRILGTHGKEPSPKYRYFGLSNLHCNPQSSDWLNESYNSIDHRTVWPPPPMLGARNSDDKSRCVNTSILQFSFFQGSAITNIIIIIINDSTAHCKAPFLVSRFSKLLDWQCQNVKSTMLLLIQEETKKPTINSSPSVETRAWHWYWLRYIQQQARTEEREQVVYLSEIKKSKC